MCQVLRGGVTIDTVMLDLPNAGDASLAPSRASAACATRRVESTVFRRTRAMISCAFWVTSTRSLEAKTIGSTRRPARWLDSSSRRRRLPARRETTRRRESAFLEHVERVLTDECAERPNDEDESDDDVSLRSNALRPMRERLAAGCGARRRIPLRPPSRFGPAVVAAVRGATRHPLANELATFFESSSVRKKLGIITAWERGEDRRRDEEKSIKSV